MAIAYDAFTAGTKAADAGTSLTIGHTPVGTPRAVLVLAVAQANSGNDSVSGVTYGGTAMTEVTGSPMLKSTGEAGSVYGYFLGASVPTGAQNAVLTVSASTNIRAVVITYTAAGDCQVTDTDASINSDSVLDPTATLSLGGVSSACALAAFSGELDVTAVAPLANWTARDEHDFGPNSAYFYTYDIVGTADVTIGINNTTADDCILLGVAISEIASGGHTKLSGKLGYPLRGKLG